MTAQPKWCNYCTTDNHGDKWCYPVLCGGSSRGEVSGSQVLMGVCEDCSKQKVGTLLDSPRRMMLDGPPITGNCVYCYTYDGKIYCYPVPCSQGRGELSGNSTLGMQYGNAMIVSSSYANFVASGWTSREPDQAPDVLALVTPGDNIATIVQPVFVQYGNPPYAQFWMFYPVAGYKQATSVYEAAVVPLNQLYGGAPAPTKMPGGGGGGTPVNYNPHRVSLEGPGTPPAPTPPTPTHPPVPQNWIGGYRYQLNFTYAPPPVDPAPPWSEGMLQLTLDAWFPGIFHVVSATQPDPMHTVFVIDALKTSTAQVNNLIVSPSVALTITNLGPTPVPSTGGGPPIQPGQMPGGGGGGTPVNYNPHRVSLEGPGTPPAPTPPTPTPPPVPQNWIGGYRYQLNFTYASPPASPWSEGMLQLTLDARFPGIFHVVSETQPDPMHMVFVIDALKTSTAQAFNNSPPFVVLTITNLGPTPSLVPQPGQMPGGGGGTPVNYNPHRVSLEGPGQTGDPTKCDKVTTQAIEDSIGVQAMDDQSPYNDGLVGALPIRHPPPGRMGAPVTCGKCGKPKA